MVGEKQNAPLRRTGWRFAFAFCAVGIIINLAGAKLASLLALPLYLDSIGTILSAGLGGYIPGIAVGFVTNLLNSASDPSTAYYGALNVLIAICAASFARKKWYSQFGKLPTMALVFALIGGTLGSVLTWMLAGFSMGSGITAPLALTLAQGGLPPFPAQCVADTAIDFLDKLICTLAAMLVMRFILKRFPGELWFHDWKQDSVPEKVRKARGDRFSRKMPIGRKILLLIAAAMVVIAIVVTGISFAQFHSANIESQTRLAYGVANVVSDSFDHDRVDEYIRLGENAEGYAESERRMASLMASSDDIEYVYVYQILPDGCHVVFDPDTSEETGANAGDIIPFDAAFDPYLPALLAGEAVEPIISNETYGWLLTVYVPVIDSAGECACYAAVDISMQRLMVNEYVFLTRTLSLFLGFFLLILAIGVYLARYNIVLPINAMAVTANAFAYNSEEARADSVSRIKALNIRTGDEIENLYNAFVKTSEDTVRYIADAQEKNETIAKLQNGMIVVLADLVESRDKCTGNHVKNTATYAKIIMEQMRHEGIYADQMTDEFISDVVNSAPLHDVGKIKVSDTLLNKPGRLTDEEFSAMQGHTTAGSEIITRAIDLVSESKSGYLKEAKNLAAYHHERWDGTGYPSKLKGEEIPLSARIMAVADVFDALVAKRSYKEGFPFDKAMDIIREGQGTHFDPLVTQAFLDAEYEVRKVVEANRANGM